MIVMRAVPLARDALLGRIGALPSARLPAPEMDMQVRDVLKSAVPGEEERPSLRELISVFLTPDVGRDLSAAEIRERASEQRLDGVLPFGGELVVVIESKVVGEASSVSIQGCLPPVGFMLQAGRRRGTAGARVCRLGRH